MGLAVREVGRGHLGTAEARSQTLASLTQTGLPSGHGQGLTAGGRCLLDSLRSCPWAWGPGLRVPLGSRAACPVAVGAVSSAEEGLPTTGLPSGPSRGGSVISRAAATAPPALVRQDGG